MILYRLEIVILQVYTYFCLMNADLQNKSFSLNCNGRLVTLSKPKIMGILNLTPDSFSDGGLFNNSEKALKQAEKMISEGAEIIDVGAQSTRPGAQFLEATEEIRRIGKTVEQIKKEFPEILVSLDTFWGETVRFGYNEGIDIVNDISAGQFDSDLLPAVAHAQIPYILMHSNASYSKMHYKIKYEDITLSVNQFLMKKTQELQDMGIQDIIWDPGFGFGKTIEDQHILLSEIEYLGFGNYPILVGISRKSFIYKPLGKTPLDINTETQELHLKVLKYGAKILRVHDVGATQKTLKEIGIL